MIAGRLRHRLQVQAPLESRDDIGGVTRVWVAVGDVWAHIEPLKGRELFEAQSIEARLNTRVTMRAFPDLDPTWRLVWLDKDRAYQVYSVRDVDERHRMTEVLCQEILH